ncbi:MAG: hypothetical protein ACRDQZ_02950, partial [Mycobacteriales bacterium]
EFDVLINAPPGTTAATPDSPYYAGTISFFGFTHGMSGEATFIVPLPRNLPASNGPLHVQVVPHSDLTTLEATARPKTESVLKSVAVTAW